MGKGAWNETAADVVVGAAVGAMNQGLVDRNPGKGRMITGGLAVGSGVLGLALKIWSSRRSRGYPGWQDDIGDSALTSGALLGGQLGMRQIDIQQHVVQTGPTGDAGLLSPDQYNLAVKAGDLPSGIQEVDGGYPLTPAQLETALTDNPGLKFNPTDALWDDPDATESNWTTGG